MLLVCVLAMPSCGRYLCIFGLACLEEYTVQFASYQDGIYALGKSHMRATKSLRRFPNVAFNTVHLIDDGPFSSFQRISLSVSSFHAAPLLAIVGVMLSALSPQVVFQAPKHQVFRDACHLL